MRLYRCWCKHEWDAELGPVCSQCFRTTKFPAFTREHIAEGIHTDHDEGPEGGAVTTLNLEKITPGIYDDDNLFVGSLDSPEYDAWCARKGLGEE